MSVRIPGALLAITAAALLLSGCDSSSGFAGFPEPAAAAATTAQSTTERTQAQQQDANAVIYDCDSQASQRPDTLILTCADNSETLEDLSWTNWGAPTAKATGQLGEDSCDPDCADGTATQYAVTVTVTGLKGGRYTTMHVTAPKAPDASASYSLDPDGPTRKS